MCGISGIFNQTGEPVNTATLLKMTQIIRHRGPDDEGFALAHSTQGSIKLYSHNESTAAIKQTYDTLPLETQANLAFGFRRLAIIDLSEQGHQPMLDPTGQYCLTLNGEIYNYIELKNELKQLGHQFITQSDTEVFIQAYKQWGPDALKKCVGMFALALWDNHKKILLLARDRLGKKPLNYYYKNGQLYWASEEKQITSIPQIKKSVNEKELMTFLHYGFSFETNHTFYNEIKQLPPGHYAIVDQHNFNEYDYWNFNPTHDQSLSDFNQAKTILQQQLNQAIEWRLRSDVPVGIALSGGLDSSSIACLAKKNTNRDIHTFSVFYPGTKFDERKYIQEVLNGGGFIPSYSTQDNQLSIQEISDFVFHQDAPVSSASPLSAYRNYKHVRNAGIIVLLNGQGGDELFAGYPYYYKYYWAQLLGNYSFQKLATEMIHAISQHGASECFKTLSLSILSKLIAGKNLRKTETSKYSKHRWFSHDGDIEEVKNPDTKIDGLEKVLLSSLRQTHMPHMLHWEDRNSMAHSIESRVPFLDHRMVELSFQIPAHFKINNNTQKYILRQAMHGIVPDMILNRKDKIGFGTPTDEWTSSLLKNEITAIFNDKQFLERPFWNGKLIRDQYTQNPKAFGVNEVWRILTTELWLKHFFD